MLWDRMLFRMSMATSQLKRLAFFERYLTVWVLLCMVVGVGFMTPQAA